MKSSCLLSIIMPTCDRGDVFEIAKTSVLESIKGLDIEYIVINDSKKSPLIFSKTEEQQIRAFDNPNQGVASARNYGATLASSENIMFLDDDMILRRENIEHVLSLLENVDLASLCFNIEWVYPPQLISKIDKTKFGRFLVEHGFTTMRGWANYPDWPENDFFEIEGLASYCLVISKQNFNKLGGYNEKFPHAGFEDDEFSKRVAQSSKIYLSTRSIIWHNESDRVEVRSWLLRKERGGETRRVAVDLGRKEVELHFSTFKKLSFKLIHSVKEPIIKLLEFLPNKKLFDPIYFKGIKVLLGTATFIGYTKNLKKR